MPLTNFVGWYLCVFTFYFVFAVYLRASNGDADATAITTRGFWTLPILMYASIAIEFWGDWLSTRSTQVTDQAGHVWHTGDILGSMVLASVFTMSFVSFLGLVLIWRDDAVEAAVAVHARRPVDTRRLHYTEDLMSAGIPALVFDGSGVPREHHFEVFHEFTAPVFDTAPLGDVDVFDLATTDYLVDDLVVSRLRYGPQTLRRTETHLDDATSEWVTVQVYLDGKLTGQAGGSALQFDPQRIGVLDMAEPFATWGARTDAIWVCVPRSRLMHVDDRYGDHPLRSLHRSSPRGMVLGAAIERLWRQLPHARVEDDADLAAGIVETIDIALRTERYTPTDRDLTTAMKHYIAANLDDHDLGVASLQHTFHCSRATLYRLFEQYGGVATYIREQRLVRCFDELSRPGDPPPPVGTVATRWGFENPSHFHRVFVAMFGLPPSALTRRPLFEPVGNTADATTAAQIDQFHRWAEARI